MGVQKNPPIFKKWAWKKNGRTVGNLIRIFFNLGTGALESLNWEKVSNFLDNTVFIFLHISRTWAECVYLQKYTYHTSIKSIHCKIFFFGSCDEMIDDSQAI